MPRARHTPVNTTDVQVLTGDTTLYGIAIQATAGATVVVHDGTSTAGPVVAIAHLAAAGSVAHMIPAVEIETGLFIDRTNASQVLLYTS